MDFQPQEFGSQASQGLQATEGIEQRSPLVLRYLRIAKRWKWLIAGTMSASVILGLVVTLLMTPQYSAEATLEIQREGSQLVNLQQDRQQTSTVDLEFYQTQYSLLRSRVLAERVATDLRLFDDASFFEAFGDDQMAGQIGEEGRASSAASRAVRTRRAGELLLDHLAVSPIRASRLVDVEITSADPQLSARIANAWTRHFIQSNLERRFEATTYARRFLEGRLEQLRGRLEQSERLLVAYASQQRIINLPTTTPAAGNTPGSVVERPLVAEDLAAVNQELNQATAARIAAQSRLRSGGAATVEALQNAAISTLRGRRAELAAEHARLLTQFDAQYPPAIAMANQIRELDRSIAREEGRVRSTLQEVYNAAVARESQLQDRVRTLQADLLNLRNRTIQYNIYQRDVDTNRQLYDGLLQRYKEIGVAGVGVNNVTVVDAAEVPQRPSSPNLLRNLLLALLLGSVAATGLAMAFDQMDETISDPRDLEASLGLPLLGTIPRTDEATASDELNDPKSPLVEAYLSTQTRLAFATDHGFPRTLLVSSSRPGEGKTTTSHALARTLARTGRRVLLVDADMRSPSLHHLFAVPNDRGFSNYLSGGAEIAEIARGTESSGLSLVVAGPAPPNAAELLTGTKIQKFLGEAAQAYDHVIFDVPPVMGLADTPLIASQVEGVVFVIESHATPVAMARVAVGRLEGAQARILGAVLTKFETKRAHYGYGYDYGYGYGETARDNQ